MGLSTSALRTAVAVSLGASAFLLTACSNPVGASAGGDAASAQNGATSDTSTSSASSAEAVAAVTLPADFPAAVHLVSGDIITASGSKDAWQVVIAGQGTQAEFNQAKQKLESAGFSEVFFNDDNAVYTGEYSNGDYTVQLIVGAPDFKGTAYFISKIF